MDKNFVIFSIVVTVIIAAIILAIITTRTLKKDPTIELVQGKLNDEESTDDIAEAIKELKIVNK